MPFCDKATSRCPVIINLELLLKGTLHPDSFAPSAFVNELSASEIKELAMQLVLDGSCDGPEVFEEDLGVPEDPSLDNIDSVIAGHLGGTVFCGLDTCDRFEEDIENVYGVNLTVSDS